MAVHSLKAVKAPVKDENVPDIVGGSDDSPSHLNQFEGGLKVEP